MFGIDESRRTARLLRFGDDVQRQRGLARAFRPIDFDHPALGKAADAQRDIEPERTGRNRFDLHRFLRAQLHRRTLAKRTVDLSERGFERLLTVHGFLVLFNQLQLRSHRMRSFTCLEAIGIYRRPARKRGCIPFVPTEQERNENNFLQPRQPLGDYFAAAAASARCWRTCCSTAPTLSPIDATLKGLGMKCMSGMSMSLRSCSSA